MATGFVSSVENSRTGVKSNVDGSRDIQHDLLPSLMEVDHLKLLAQNTDL